MANKKYKLTDGNMWATDGIHDFGQNKTQRTINSEVNTALGGKAPTNHASTSTTYGKGTSSNYGHVKISDSLTDTTPAATGGVVPSMKAVSDLNGAINSLNNVVGISQLSDLSLYANHFIQFLANVSVGGITIPRHSRGVLVSSSGSDATLYAIDTSGNLYVSYRNSGTWTNAKNITADITALNDAINAITPLDTAPTQNSTKGITSDAVYKKTTEQIIYQDNGSYTNNIGVNLNLTEAIEGHSFLKVVTFIGSIASNTRIILLYPIGGGACYLPAPVDTNYNYVRCEAHDKIFSIISSSYNTLYVRSIGLIL